MENWRRDRIASAEHGENPTVLLRLPSGFAVMGDTQFLPGYCLLLAMPRVPDLHALALSERIAFLRDMSLLGEAVQRVCQPSGSTTKSLAILIRSSMLMCSRAMRGNRLTISFSRYHTTRASYGLPANTSSPPQRMVSCRTGLGQCCGTWWRPAVEIAPEGSGHKVRPAPD